MPKIFRLACGECSSRFQPCVAHTEPRVCGVPYMSFVLESYLMASTSMMRLFMLHEKNSLHKCWNLDGSRTCGRRCAPTLPSETVVAINIDAPGHLWSAHTAHRAAYKKLQILQEFDVRLFPKVRALSHWEQHPRYVPHQHHAWYNTVHTRIRHMNKCGWKSYLSDKREKRNVVVYTPPLDIIYTYVWMHLLKILKN
jgi:hypothetical protein